MQQEVFVRFSADQEIVVPLSAQAESMPADVARRWLDDQFIANDCEPLRASGKVLTADKLLAIAQAVGPQRFEGDIEFRQGYARAALAAMGKPVVRVDLELTRVSYSP